jgi:hypothetical protein
MRTQLLIALMALLTLRQPPLARAQTPQQLYDQAEVALEKGDAAAAVDIFADLAARLQKSSSLSKYQLLARYGDALMRNGEAAEAAAVLEQALDGGKAKLSAAEVDDIYKNLAPAYLDNFDFAAAANRYAILIERMQPQWARLPAVEKTSLHLQYATALFWSGSDQAEKSLDAALANVDRKDKTTLETQSYIESMRARFALSRGDMKAASASASRATRFAGGITQKTTLIDRTIRQDAALVAWFRNDKAKFLEYTAMSGAARLGEGNKGWLDKFGAIAEGTMPHCASFASITADDVVVIDFSINKQGRPITVRPIYSSKRGQIEKPFLEAAQSWSFNETMGDLSYFWRDSYRVAMRCQTATSDRPTALKMPESVATLLARDYQTLGLPSDTFDRRNEPQMLRKILALYDSRLAANPNDPLLGPLLFAMAQRESTSTAKREKFTKEFLVLAQRQPGLAPVAAYWEVQETATAKALLFLENSPTLAQWPETLALARAKLGLLYEGERNKAAAMSAYQRLIDSDAAAQSPYRLMALLHLASLVQKKDPAKAEALFKATSLQPEQCALYDLQPVPRNSKYSYTSDDDFQFFFESRGWIHSEMDINAKGDTEKVRIVASYPPFLLEDGAKRIYNRMAFQPIFRGNGEGCKGYSRTQSVIFKNSN